MYIQFQLKIRRIFNKKILFACQNAGHSADLWHCATVLDLDQACPGLLTCDLANSKTGNAHRDAFCDYCCNFLTYVIMNFFFFCSVERNKFLNFVDTFSDPHWIAGGNIGQFIVPFVCFRVATKFYVHFTLYSIQFQVYRPEDGSMPKHVTLIN
jgi:hypothetical protein